MSFDFNKLIEEAVEAVNDEIEAVRKQPSHDILYDGEQTNYRGDGEYHYKFETHNPSIQYAESIRAEMDEEEFEVHPVGLENGVVTLSFPENKGDRIPKVELEWENDFVLLKVRDELLAAKEEEESTEERIEALFDPDLDEHAGDPEQIELKDDGQRNRSQREAIRKSLSNRSLYVWGPPGTGKTATLGFMVANYLERKKKVLLASNTNRAVDVGLLSSLQACRDIGLDHMVEECTRFGEPALDHRRVLDRSFDHLMEEKEQQQKEKAAKLDERLEQYYKLEQELHDMDPDDEDREEAQRNLELMEKRIESDGGEAALEAKIDRLKKVNERVELEKFQLVATTLARVCTSDLFRDLEFDAIVVDEGSMANLPYLIALARKARAHVVVVGDPMQLPPIALTNKRDSKAFLERDIFGWVSEAESTEELFKWHDANRPLTCFFDKQYRLKAQLAGIVSSVFYEGRLKTAGAAQRDDGQSNELIVLADSARYEPHLTRNEQRRGFSPINEVHQFLLKRIVQQKVLKEQVRMEDIGVIVPFRSTVYDYRNMLTGEGYRDVEVGTIHTFQGREKRVILFDTVMTAELKNGRRRHFTVRPFDEAKNGLSVPRLLNVAFSRCEEQLYVIADMDHVERMYGDKFLGRLLGRIQQEGRNILQSKSPVS